jgi:trk system potassium uptake protein TrkH
MNYPLVLRHLGIVAIVYVVAMIAPLGCAAWYGERSAMIAFAVSIGINAGIAFALMWVGRKAPDKMFQRESLALVGITWILAAVLGAFPFMLSGTFSSPIDALFESTSGITTTGSTVLADIEAAPRSILFWRALMQWMGGIGIAVLFVAVLPYLGAGGKQLFKLEAPGPESHTFRPRIRDTAAFICRLYLGLTFVLFVIFLLEGMTPFDAICHTFTTVATGGFSTKQASIAAFDSVLIEMTVVIFMIISAINFGLFFAMLRGHRDAVWRNAEFRVFIGILVFATAAITLNLTGVHGDPGAASDAAIEQGVEGAKYHDIENRSYGFGEALRVATFQVASIGTTSGFVTTDFDAWPHFSRTLLLVLMFVGACGGSTAGGFKIVRIMMLLKMAFWRVEQSFRPKTIRLVRIGEEVVDEEVQRRVSGFFVLFLLWFVMGTLLLSAYGLPLETATTAVLATLNNIGPGLGLVGASVDYHVLPPAVKLFLSFCMVLGRLEIFTICVLFIPSFWRSKWTR